MNMPVGKPSNNPPCRHCPFKHPLSHSSTSNQLVPDEEHSLTKLPLHVLSPVSQIMGISQFCLSSGLLSVVPHLPASAQTLVCRLFMHSVHSVHIQSSTQGPSSSGSSFVPPPMNPPEEPPEDPPELPPVVWQVPQSLGQLSQLSPDSQFPSPQKFDMLTERLSSVLLPLVKGYSAALVFST